MLNFNEFQLATSASKPKSAEKTETPSTTSNTTATKELERKEILTSNPSQAVFSKSQLATTLVITSIISGTLMYALGKRAKCPTQEVSRLANDAFKEAQEKLSKAETQISDLTQKNTQQSESITRLEDLVEKLRKKVADNSQVPEETKEQIEFHTAKYRKIIEDTTQIYEGASAPMGEGISRPSYINYFPFAKSKFTTAPKQGSNFVNGLLESLNLRKRVEIPQKKISSSPEKIKTALLDESSIGELGKPQKTNILIEYGKNTDWSDEKIARDILQNFYDGNNHNLDDVGLLIEKTASGSYKVRISGNGVFDHKKLMFLGATSKKNPFDAGGFGEGVKVVSTCMISKGHAKNIRFGSADWELMFDESQGILRTTLDKSAQVLDGNFIEFETNELFAKDIVKAFDFFKHSKNPDFQNLTFENSDFGFRILEKGKKGNFYLTQRFEYDREGQWQGGVDGLDIIFKKRPNDELYEKISGNKFSTGRDRVTMHDKDVHDLTRCAVKDLSNEDLIQSLLSTQHHWFDIRSGEDKAIKSFVKALVEEATERKVGLDFSSEKICYLENYANEVVRDAVRSAGYRIVPADDCNFDKIGMPGATKVFKSLSKHTPITPSAKEAKKMKVLEEAIKVIQENFESTYVAKLQDIFSKISYKDLKPEGPYGSTYTITEFLNTIDDIEFFKDFVEKNYMRYLIIDDSDEFYKKLYEYISKKIQKINQFNIDDKENKEIVNLLASIFEYKKLDNPRLEQYGVQLKNLQIISRSDVTAPRFIFDRQAETAKNTLGEAIINSSEYGGHWIDKTYLNNGNFYDLVSTWIHEICHKSGGDGTSEFTYKLTDILESILTSSCASSDMQIKLSALEKVFSEIK